MNTSNVIQTPPPSPPPPRRIVAGTVKTTMYAAAITVSPDGVRTVCVHTGKKDNPEAQYFRAADLREAATFFNELADILDQQKS